MLPFDNDMKAHDVAKLKLDILLIEIIFFVNDSVQFIDETFHVQPERIEL